MKQVTDNVYVETGYRGCNPGFVITSSGVVMVDTPQRPSDALLYKTEIEKLGKIVYLINTEPHGDHFAGNFFFNVPCIAHQGTREVLEQASLGQLKERLGLIDPEYAPMLSSYEIHLPDITFIRSMKLYVGEHTFELINLPGHTASETAVFVPQERIVFTGDNIFHGVQTFLHEAVPNEWLNSLEYLKKLDVDTFIPGHGEICSVEYLDEQALFIKEWIAVVKDAIKKGWSLEESREGISLLHRYPMSDGMEDFGPELQKMNVSRLYSLITSGQL